MKPTINDYFRQHWAKVVLFVCFTAAVSFFAPLKSFQLKWLIDSKSKQEALGYMALVFLLSLLVFRAPEPPLFHQAGLRCR